MQNLKSMTNLFKKKNESEENSESIGLQEDPRIILEDMPEETKTLPQLKGYLLKKGDKGMIKTWKNRWFVLTPNRELNYYETEESTQEKGAIKLELAAMNQTTKPIRGLPKIDPFAFSIEVPGRSYILKAADQEDYNYWVNGVTLVLGTIKKEKLEESSQDRKKAHEETSPQRVKAANLCGLVLALTLTHDELTDSEFSATFLITYRSFTTGLDLMNALINRYKQTKDPEMDSESATKIRLKILEFLKQWISDISGCYDLMEDKKLLTQVQVFLKSICLKDLKVQSQEILDLLEKRLLESKHLNYEKISMLAPIYELEKKLFENKDKFPTSILPKSWPDEVTTENLLNKIDALEISRQLTLLEFSYFHGIQPKEFLDQNWTRKERDIKSPNIMSITKRFNKTSGWVATAILKGDMKERSKRVTKFIQIAQKCRELNNFNSCMAIIAGLESSCIFRLKKTWQTVSPGSVAIFEQLKDLTSQQHNFSKLRSVVEHSTLPCLPYIGIHLTDLVFIEDGNPNTLGSNSIPIKKSSAEGEPKKATSSPSNTTPPVIVPSPNPESMLINFSKRRQVAAVIRYLQKFQKVPFLFDAVPKLQTLLQNVETKEEKELYNLSLQLEPRDST